MSSISMRRYVGDALGRRADDEGWEALRAVAGMAGGIGPLGPPELALRACRAAGGRDEAAYPAAASLTRCTPPSTWWTT